MAPRLPRIAPAARTDAPRAVERAARHALPLAPSKRPTQASGANNTADPAPAAGDAVP